MHDTTFFSIYSFWIYPFEAALILGVHLGTTSPPIARLSLSLQKHWQDLQILISLNQAHHPVLVPTY